MESTASTCNPEHVSVVNIGDTCMHGGLSVDNRLAGTELGLLDLKVKPVDGSTRRPE